MQLLSFSQIEATLEASFVTSDDTVIQFNAPRGSRPFIRIFARLSEDMPWVLVKNITTPPPAFVIRVNLPAGAFVKIATDSPLVTAGISDGGSYTPTPDTPVDTLLDSEGFLLSDADGFVLDCL